MIRDAPASRAGGTPTGLRSVRTGGRSGEFDRPGSRDYLCPVEQAIAAYGRSFPTFRPILTNFYPRYDGANDQVDPVSAVRSVRFQRVEPRYRLSTSETRDQGTGPAFIESSYTPMTMVRGTEESNRRPAENAAVRSPARPPAPAPLPPDAGTLIDLFA